VQGEAVVGTPDKRDPVSAATNTAASYLKNCCKKEVLSLKAQRYKVTVCDATKGRQLNVDTGSFNYITERHIQQL
jgi:hypothetical protein